MCALLASCVFGGVIKSVVFVCALSCKQKCEGVAVERGAEQLHCRLQQDTLLPLCWLFNGRVSCMLFSFVLCWLACVRVCGVVKCIVGEV
jgi:hypothetical protein